MHFDERWLPTRKTSKSRVLYDTAIIVLLGLVFWFAGVFLNYLTDDWLTPAADETKHFGGEYLTNPLFVARSRRGRRYALERLHTDNRER